MGWGRQVQLEISHLKVEPMSFVTGSARIAKADINKREKHTNTQSANTSVNQNGIVLHSPFLVSKPMDEWLSQEPAGQRVRYCL